MRHLISWLVLYVKYYNHMEIERTKRKWNERKRNYVNIEAECRLLVTVHTRWMVECEMWISMYVFRIFCIHALLTVAAIVLFIMLFVFRFIFLIIFSLLLMLLFCFSVTFKLFRSRNGTRLSFQPIRHSEIFQNFLLLLFLLVSHFHWMFSFIIVVCVCVLISSHVFVPVYFVLCFSSHSISFVVSL